MSTPLPSQTVFLLGAGASRPAGLPTIDEMTTEFKEEFLSKEDDPEVGLLPELIQDFEELEKATSDHFGKTDLEYLMTMIIQLEEPRLKAVFDAKYPKLKKFDLEWLQTLRNAISEFIRRRCEELDSSHIEYLWPFQGFIDARERLQIFTLNYDATLEIFCEKSGISFSDGFDPYWNPASFQNATVNIYKLHGSLYWLRTQSGKLIKVPIKGLDVSEVRYLTDESVTEMMIYPALQKSKQSEVYSWLSQQLIETLNIANTFIVIGYSFRDEDIRKNIIDALYRNPDLWVIIVSPNATSKKLEYFPKEIDIASRIVTLDQGMENAFGDRGLMELFQTLMSARRDESRTWSSQSFERTIIGSYWSGIVGKYLEVKHDDRIKWITQKLLVERKTHSGSDPFYAIERMVGHKALKYMFEEKQKKNFNGFELWKSIFLGYYTACEYTVS